MLGTILLMALIVLLTLALVFSTAQKYLTRWFFKRDLPWTPLFSITLLMGAVYAALTMAFATTLAFYGPLIFAPIGIVVHAVLVKKLIADSNGAHLRLREAILGQALTILMYAAQHSPTLFNLLRGFS